MRTTIRINDDLLKQAKKQAAGKGCTLASLVEDGLALILSKPKTGRRKRVDLPISKATGDILPGIDLNRSGDLEEVIRFCGILIAQPHCVIIEPGEGHWRIFRRLCTEADARGNLVPDAWFAALAIEFGCE